jgi:hypothetical protein
MEALLRSSSSACQQQEAAEVFAASAEQPLM